MVVLQLDKLRWERLVEAEITRTRLQQHIVDTDEGSSAYQTVSVSRYFKR